MLKQNLTLALYKSLSLDQLYEVISGIQTKISMDGEARLDVSRTKSDKVLYTIHGEHYSFEALKLMHREIRPKAEISPNDWLFLIEGIPTGDIPEVIYGYVMGNKLGIPTENPIKDCCSKEVVERAIESGIKPEDVYLALSIEMFKAVPNLEKVISGLSKMWNVSPNYLRGLFTYLPREVQTNPDAMNRKKEEFGGILSKIDRISNDLSSKELDRIVKRHKYRKNVFAYLGMSHGEILDRV